MQVLKADIITHTRLIIDEIRMNESDFESGQDEKDLDTLIEEFALEALRFVNINAPYNLLSADAKVSATIPPITQLAVSSEGTKVVTEEGIIPNTRIVVIGPIKGMLRFLCARCSCWNKPIYEVIQEGTPAWDKLSNRFLTGTEEDPRVSLGKPLTGIETTSYDDAEIRLYCIPGEGEMETDAEVEVYYMEQPAFSEDHKLHISYLLQDAFYYYLAYLVLMALGDQRASIALQQAYPLMGLNNNTDD